MFTLSEKNFEKIFPFYVRINNEMNIVSFGESMRKVVGQIGGSSFKDVFKFIRPALSIRYDFESLREHQDIVVIVEAIGFPIRTRFRGQFIYLSDSDEIIYLNSPWITEVHDLSLHNLLITDFAIHDTIADSLQILQSKEIVNKDLKRIADELIDQRNELLNKTETIIELARFPDQNPQPILRLDFDGNVLYANENASRLISSNSLLDLPFWGTIYMRFESNGFQLYEKEFALGDQVFHATLVPFKEKNYFNVYLRDITDTLKFQNELILTSSRLHTLLSSMQSAVLAEDAERKIIFVNQIFCDLFKIPIEPSNMVGVDCSTAANTSSVLFRNEQDFILRIDEILKDRKRVDGEILYMKNGTILERDFLPIFENGEYQGHIWRYQDITNLIQSKESLKKVEEKYRRIIENLELGLIEVDLEENITKVYPAFCRMTGYSEEELIGANARLLLAFDEDFSALDQQGNLRKEGKPGVYETRIKTKSGQVKWLIISGAPIIDFNGNVVGSLGIHVDITDRKKLEEDLIEANEKAMSSVKMKEMFVANISHEIRTPMNVILGMMDLIGEDGLDPDQSKYLQTVKKSADTLLTLINDLLDFSKIEAGQLTLEEIDTDIYDMIEHIEFSFGEKAKARNIQLITDVDSRISKDLVSDKSKLNQVLFNLVSNAIKFTDKGYVSVSCKLLEDHPEFQSVRFEVKDTGVGISPESLESIFQTFIQEDASISRKYGGTGLGLSISREIVQRMGGDIKVYSEKSKGSLFEFQVRFQKGPFEKKPPVFSTNRPEDIAGYSILVAEDNPLNQTLIRSIFNQIGITIDLVENGEEALGLLAKKKYDILLLDIQMPVMDGITTARHIREVLRLDVPIIALTANASADDEKIYRSIGMNGYLAKPYRKEDLFELMFSLVEKIKVDSTRNEISDDIKPSKEEYSLKEVEEISGGDESFVISIITTFQNNTPEHMNKISMGIAKNDFEMVRRFSHQLKPSLDIFKVTEGSSLIRELEHLANVNKPDKVAIKNVFAKLKLVVDRVLKDLYVRYNH